MFNIGNDSEMSIMGLARQVREMCSSQSDIVLIPYEKAYEQGFEDMPRRVPDISKIGALVDWKPTIDLPRILTDVIEYCRHHS